MKHADVLLALALVSGCNPHAAAPPAGAWTRSAPPYPRVRATRTKMSTDVTVIVAGDDAAKAERAGEQAYAAIDRIVARMNRYVPSSEISAFNRAAGGAPVTVSPEFHALLAKSLAVSAATDGAFDVTVAPLLALWKNARRRVREPSAEELAGALRIVGPRALVVKDGTARLAEAGMSITLDGIAKGASVDEAVLALRAAGARSALVEAGGEIGVLGRRPDGKKWRVGVRDPRDPTGTGYVLVLGLADKACATSGNYERYFEIGGKRYSHIVNPKTGRPCDAVPSVTVIAKDCTTADAYATGLSVLGVEKGLRLVDALPDIECLMITVEDGKLRYHRSKGFEAYEVE